MITTLMNAKEKPIKSSKTLKAIAKVGQAVNVAVDRFVSVGEAIADDSLDVKTEMYAACHEARAAGAAIQRLTELQYDKKGELVNLANGMEQSSANGKYIGSGSVTDKRGMVKAARALLSSVTKVLLLADTVVVKQLLSAKEKVSISLHRLENVTNFTEFVKAFSLFGTEMVELAHLTGDRQNDLKDEKRRAQMSSARQILERSTMMLLTSSKTCLRHPDCDTARENRDTVFCQMRRAMDMIHFVVKDGVIPDLASTTPDHTSNLSTVIGHGTDDLDNNFTVHNTIKRLEDIVEMTRMTLAGACYRERLTSALDSVIECTQDFTDSAYTSHEHRQNILLLCDRIRLHLNRLLAIGIAMEQSEVNSPTDELEAAIVTVLNSTNNLRQQLEETTLNQIEEVQDLCRDQQDHHVLYSMRNSAMAGDANRLEEYTERFHEQAEHLHEVCKLMWHIAQGHVNQVCAKQIESNIRIYGPQIPCACRTVSMNPSSKIAKENLDVFVDVWISLCRDMGGIIGDILEHQFHIRHSDGRYHRRQRHKKQQMLQNQPMEDGHNIANCHGVAEHQSQRHSMHDPSTKILKAERLDCEEKAKIAKLGLEMKLLTSEIDAETEKWEETENNDIVKRAKNMSAMAFSMYQFTKGEGMLKTTQDLFTQAEYFAEDANKLYKLVRQFSYLVPASTQKKSLLENLDKVPTYVQQLQFTVKNPTVGKAATFTKVDNVIQETKNLMNVISKVVSTCFICATKYNLDFQGGGSGGRSSQNISPLNRMESGDDSGAAVDGSGRTISSDGGAIPNASGGSLNKPSNGQSASDPNI